MTAEFTAKKAREFTINRDDINAELWYAKYKDYLFNEITKLALKGDNSINIISDEWSHNGTKMTYLKSRLENLGYNVKIEDHLEYDRKLMTVSW